MFRLAVIVILIVVVVLSIRAMLKSPSKEVEADPKAMDMVEDPNCHTYIPKAEAVRKEIQGKEHFFCSEKCAEEYKTADRGGG